MAEVRRYGVADQELLLEFAADVPIEDRNFLKENVADREVVAAWSEPSSISRFVAVDGNSIVGYVALHPLEGWSQHVAELRVLVTPLARTRGLGQRLVQQALSEAVERGTVKVIVEVIAEHHDTLGMLQANGFTPEALLADHVQDRAGHRRDLMVLMCFPDDLVADLELTGVEDSLV